MAKVQRSFGIRFIRGLGKFVVGSTGIGFGLFLADKYLNYETAARNFRAVNAAIATAIDYKFRLNAENLDEIHSRVAKRVLSVCQKNEGLYIKLGQGIAAMNHILPPQYLKTFAVLYDKAPSVGFEEVRRIIREEFGKEPEEIFSEFEKESIASASIAQVHKAKLKDGSPVAVKIQKPQIKTQIGWDLFTYDWLVWSLEKMFQLPFYWSVEFTKESMLKETDFTNEANNSDLAKKLIEDKEGIYIPKIYREFSSKRVMTAEWIDGVRLNDQEALDKLGVSGKHAVNTVIRFISHQIFITGHVHSDPHPGNILVRKVKGKPQIVVLDHGLYIDESNLFRRQYAQFWRAMMSQNKEKLIDICKQWGIQDAELFASSQMMKPFSLNRPVNRKPSREELLRMQIEAKERVRNLLKDTSLTPKELIFVGRALNIIRANNKLFGSPVDRVSVLARYAFKGSALDQKQDKTLTFKQSIAIQYENARFELSLFVVWAAFQATRAWQYVNSLFGKKVSGFEEKLEELEKKVAQEQFGFTIQTDAG